MPPSPRDVRNAYNTRHANAIIRDSDRYYRWMAEQVSRAVAQPRRGHALLLDVGCGGGYFLREAMQLRASTFRQAHGLEISDTAIRETRRQCPSSKVVLGQGEMLPYPGSLFDSVVCLGNLEHFIDPGAGARELARVVRPDGIVWVLLPNSYYSGDLWRVIRTGYGPNHHQVIDRFATVNEWRDLLEANDLKVEAITPYNRFKWWKRLLPHNLAYHFLYRARSKPGPPIGMRS